jgi:Photoprotection regulator fluorescence recovery protein
MSSPPNPDPYPQQNEPTWSKSEKAIARTAFDAAVGRELQEVIQEAKRMANGIQKSSDLWELEHYLTERRKEIDEHVHAFGTTDVSAVSAPVIARKRRASAWQSEFCIGVGPHVSVLRTEHFGARTRSAKPVSNQRRICAQKMYV